MRSGAGWIALWALASCATPPAVDVGETVDAPIADGGPIDGGIDAGMDAGADAGAACEARPEGPARILFVGNSFTFTASMPDVLDQLVNAAGFPDPEVAMRAIGGQTLEGHRADTASDGAPARVMEGDWDVVVLQELSTRPTDALGDPLRFEEDATWFHDLAVDASPEVRVVLYETFARRAGHPYYPGTFADPAEMQDQLRYWYDDCAERYVPMHTATGRTLVEVARVGDAWERQLEGGEPPRLHGDDDYHPNAAGAYLTAAVFFGTLYHRSAVGLPAIGIDADVAAELQATADAITGETMPSPRVACPPELPVGDRLRVDFGPDPAKGWASHAAIAGVTGPLSSEGGVASGAVVATRGFTGVQTGGSDVNELGYPPEVSRDTLWVGSFDGHAAALERSGEVTFGGLRPGRYLLTLFASRTGDDGGAGRLTRYTLADGRFADLDAQDNTARTVTFDGVVPDARGNLVLRVAVSPDGAGRFGYLGAAVLERRE